jgi:hypothetical protein
MAAKGNALVLVVCGFGFAWLAFGQLDGWRFASDLRAKYGPPLARETFTVRPGTEMVVDYAADGNVCRIQLPPVGPGRQPGVKTPQAVDDFLVELLPQAIRGQRTREFASASGLASAKMTEYENLTITEVSGAGGRTGVTVTFKNETCKDQPVP